MLCFTFLLSLIYFLKRINADCPTGSITSYSNSSICYNFQTNSSYFLEADQFCKTLGGHLVSIHNMLDNILIAEHALVVFTDSTNNDFWIGANDLITKGQWTWLDNLPFDFSDWDKGQPQNISGADCGAVKMQDGLWTAGDCFKQKPFVCQINEITAFTSTTSLPSTTVKPKRCPDTWSYYNFTDACYKVFLSEQWLDAETRCNIDHSHLASIHSREEDVFVATLASPYSNISANFWDGQTYVGFFTEDNNKSWQWTDGTPFDYSQWATYNPDNPGIENCGQIWTSAITEQATSLGIKFGDFNNLPCKDLVSNFVCKKSPN